MLDDHDYARDSAYELSLPASNREEAATDIAIRVDDGADIVIELGSPAHGRLSAYLTADQAEDLLAALTEILRLPSDRTGSIDTTGRVRNVDDDALRLR